MAKKKKGGLGRLFGAITGGPFERLQKQIDKTITDAASDPTRHKTTTSIAACAHTRPPFIAAAAEPPPRIPNSLRALSRRPIQARDVHPRWNHTQPDSLRRNSTPAASQSTSLRHESTSLHRVSPAFAIKLVHEGGGVDVLDEIDGARIDGLHRGDGEQVEGEGRDEGRLLHGGLRLGELLVHADELVEVHLKLGVVGVDDLGEDGRGGLVGLVDDVHVELGGVQADGLVELGAGVVVEVHGHVHGQAEEPGPQLSLEIVDELGPRLEARGEEVTVAVLILAPVLEVLEDGVELVVGVLLEVAVDGDVPPVADLLGQVRRVDDELGLEEGVLLIDFEEVEGGRRLVSRSGR